MVKIYKVASFAVVVFLVILTFVNPRQVSADNTVCPDRKKITNWNNQQQIEDKGFFFDNQTTGQSSFHNTDGTRYLKLRINETPIAWSGELSRSQISEDNHNLPSSERTKCWQPTKNKKVVAEYTIRWLLPMTLQMTETAHLWNSPFNFGQGNAPTTSAGVARSPVFGGAYLAIVSQDLTFPVGFINFAPILTVNPQEWHKVKVTLEQTHATIEVAPEDGSYSTVLSTSVPSAFEPLALSIGMDNEIFPTQPPTLSPVTSADNLDIKYLNIRYENL